MVCVEIFAGCAQLSASLKAEGFSVLPIDHKPGKAQKAKLMVLNLTKQSDIEVLLQILCTANIAYCHCAPVCGTGSRARDKPCLRNLAGCAACHSGLQMNHWGLQPSRGQTLPESKQPTHCIS